jgi:hypothetical protein
MLARTLFEEAKSKYSDGAAQVDMNTIQTDLSSRPVGRHEIRPVKPSPFPFPEPPSSINPPTPSLPSIGLPSQN